MKQIIILVSILFSNNIFSETITMCNKLELVGYVNHAQISNSADFRMDSRSKYDIELVSTNNKDHTKTDLFLDTGIKKQLVIVNDCESKDVVLSLDINY